MTANHAWMLKGWLLAEHAPAPIMEAVEAVIESLSKAQPEISGDPRAIELRRETPPADPNSAEEADSREDIVPEHGDLAAPEESLAPIAAEEKKPRKKHSMSPENRAAAGERMRAMQAAKKAARDQDGPATIASPPPVKPYQPVSVEKLRTDHDEYVGKRAGQPLADADWPDIKAMLAKNPDRRKIAIYYDADLEALNCFITSCQRREQSGNVLAPVLGA